MIAAAVKRDRGHLPAGDHLAQLGAGGLDVQRVVNHAHRLSNATDLQRSVERERRVRIDHHAGTLKAGKTGSLYLQFIMANRQTGNV